MRYHTFQTPDTENEWKDVVTQFSKRWNYPGCLGAVDGKHVRINCPAGSGSTFYNYKGFYSIVLMAVVNGNYEFIYANAGAEGKTADGGCWRQCDFAKALEKERLNLPPDVQLDAEHSIPCHLVADDAFAMGRRLLKPYPQRFLSPSEKVFNYRLSRARRIVENVFGIISSRFQILRTEMPYSVPHCVNIVLAICILHNFLRKHCGQAYMPPGSFDTEDINYEMLPGDWRENEAMLGLRSTHARNPLKVAKKTRETLTEHFMSPAGEVPWQYASTTTEMDRVIDIL